MDVRIKFGRYNGEVRDIEPVAARAMLADGRAELPTAARDREFIVTGNPERIPVDKAEPRKRHKKP